MKNIICIILISFAFFACAKKPVKVEQYIKPKQMAVQRIFFTFNSDKIDREAALKIDENVNMMKNDQKIYLILEGHCDKIGSQNYNLYLGDKRARSVANYLVSHGIQSNRIVAIISFGKKKPLVNGNSQDDLKQNRRVEFLIR